MEESHPPPVPPEVSCLLSQLSAAAHPALNWAGPKSYPLAFFLTHFSGTMAWVSVLLDNEHTSFLPPLFPTFPLPQGQRGL